MGRESESVVRTFWHGAPLNSYQILCLQSFVSRGHVVEVFTYDPSIALPPYVKRRDANDIWPTDRVLVYQTGEGTGGPSLHANRFRYAMLHRLGGWWVDLDVLLMQETLPDDEFYFAHEKDGFISNAIMKAPAGSEFIKACLEKSIAVGEGAKWGQTGPRLLTAMVAEHEMQSLAQPYESAFPIYWNEVEYFFDPEKAGEVEERSSGARFLHLYNEIWRRAKIPTAMLPPRGSYLDAMLEKFGVTSATEDRLETAEALQLLRKITKPDNTRILYEGIARLGEESEQLRREIGRLRQENGRLEQEVGRLKQEADNTGAALAEVSADREAMLRSRSWRLTEPLRKLMRLAPVLHSGLRRMLD